MSVGTKKVIIPQSEREELFRRFSSRHLWRQRVRPFLSRASWWTLVGIIKVAKRALDFTLALALVIIFSPLIITLLIALRTRGAALRRESRMGRWCEPFDMYSFNLSDDSLLTKLGIRRLAVLFNIIKGDMSFIGPRAVAAGELSLRERSIRRRFDARPGLLCLWWIRRRANIDYGNEAESDSEYVETQSLRKDFGIALRAIPALLYGEGVAVASDIISILSIRINNLTMTETLDAMDDMIASPESHQICFVNADCANIAYRNCDYLRAINLSTLTLADGIGMKLAGRMLRRGIKQNVNGSDLFPRLCERLAVTGKGIFLLGGREGVAEGVRDWIHSNYPEAKVCGARHGYFTEDEEADVINEIRQSGASVLLVAFGAPRQDLWISRHLSQTGVKVAMGVGGLFDFYSGRIRRAPQWMRECGMEWLYRFIQEPRRMWRRYFVGNALFLFRVLKERLCKRKT